MPIGMKNISENERNEMSTYATFSDRDKKLSESRNTKSLVVHPLLVA